MEKEACCADRERLPSEISVPLRSLGFDGGADLEGPRRCMGTVRRMNG